VCLRLRGRDLVEPDDEVGRRRVRLLEQGVHQGPGRALDVDAHVVRARELPEGRLERGRAAVDAPEKARVGVDHEGRPSEARVDVPVDPHTREHEHGGQGDGP